MFQNMMELLQPIVETQLNLLPAYELHLPLYFHYDVNVWMDLVQFSSVVIGAGGLRFESRAG